MKTIVSPRHERRASHSRSLMKGFTVLASLVLCLALAVKAQAEENVFVYKADAVTIYRIADRAGGMPASFLLGGDEKAKALLLAGKNICPNMFVSFLLVRGNEKILIDTGYGEDRKGRTLATIRNLGIDPAEITSVLLTHMHNDHILGLFDTANGKTKKAYPNAAVYVDEAEYRFWTNRDNIAKAPKGQESCFDTAERFAKLYGKAIHTMKKGASPLPWIETVSLPGHTEGHVGFALKKSDGTASLFGGDFLHCLAVQSRYPEVTVPWDTDQNAARKTREDLLKKVAGTGTVVLGGHFPDPGAVLFMPGSEGGYSYTFVEPSERR